MIITTKIEGLASVSVTVPDNIQLSLAGSILKQEIDYLRERTSVNLHTLQKYCEERSYTLKIE